MTLFWARSILKYNNKQNNYINIQHSGLGLIMGDNNNDNIDLGALEARVDDLINTINDLKTENTALRSQQQNLVNERAILIEKTEQARTRIESMISRLRAMESRP